MHHINQLEPPSSAETMTRQGRKNVHQNRENEREREREREKGVDI
jgi:hypothetical protein